MQGAHPLAALIVSWSLLQLVGGSVGQLGLQRTADHHAGEQGQLQDTAHAVGHHIQQVFHDSQVQTHPWVSEWVGFSLPECNYC